MLQGSDAWQPSADRATLQQRAAMLRQVRDFFYARQVLEVDTPLLARFGVTDPHLSNLTTHLSGSDHAWALQTSPEYAMKRLLAAGSGCIYQLGKAFRDDEQSARHNPEFTLLEWYRVGFTAPQLMAELGQLISLLLDAPAPQSLTYQQAFSRYLQVDPLAPDSHQALQQALANYPEFADLAQRETDVDTLQQLAMACVIEPALDASVPTFITHYPASQAALARLSPSDARVAERFELFYRGLELANGYHELTDAELQQQRFISDQQQREQLGRPPMPADRRLLAALQHGLPDCAGVAVGFDRLVMLRCGQSHIQQVLPFAIDRA
ncbi:EF-P lysine aminoacylase EpmA [Pseudidiomarina mangrovi]|uniref:EF-P lysine aminoacylase EpmA n=1 Tax=Pseudidiomarina mangrovi TaxID=2487133 RepID=UPI003D695CD0